MIASIGISLGRVCHRDRVFKVPCSRKALSVLQGQRGRLLVHWRESGLILRGEAQAMDPDLLGVSHNPAAGCPPPEDTDSPVQKNCGASFLR
jgi:hypothetical protein